MASNVIELHGVHPMRPEINGKSFDELQGLSPDRRQAAIERGMVFLTDFTWRGKSYGGNIIACDAAQAQKLADMRGLGEVIVGVLREEIIR